MPRPASEALNEAIHALRLAVADLDAGIAQLEDHRRWILRYALGEAMPALRRRSKSLPSQSIRTRLRDFARTRDRFTTDEAASVLSDVRRATLSAELSKMVGERELKRPKRATFEPGPMLG